MDSNKLVPALILAAQAAIVLKQLYKIRTNNEDSQFKDLRERSTELSLKLDSQRDQFRNLADAYEKWKANQSDLPGFMHLPELNISKPKDFPNTSTTFLIRQSAFEIFRKLSSFEENQRQNQGRDRYGLYLAGLYGVGKSVTLYIITVLAMAMGWVVVYLPRCDEWVGRDPALNQLDYILDIFFKSLNPHLSNRCVGLRYNKYTWGEVIEKGLSTSDYTTKEQYVGAIFEELVSHTKNPVLLVFDEVNAIWEAKHQNSPFFKYAAYFNRIVLNRGWKLISGTGHATFIENIPNGLRQYVKHLEPWEEAEFRNLLIHPDTCHPYLYEILKGRPDWINSISNLLGCVPRQLSILNEILSNLPNEPTPNKRLRQIIELYEKEAFIEFTSINNSYLEKLSPSRIKIHLNSLAQTFALATGVDILQDFMDNSLLYYNKKLDKCLAINPVAGRAIVSNLRKNYLFSEDPDITVILSTNTTRNERIKAFKRIIFCKILLSTSECEHTKLDGSDRQKSEIVAEYSQIIPNNVLIPQAPISRALFIPESEIYPIADCILVDPILKKVRVIQITVSPVNKKIPGSHNTTSCFYDQQRYHSLVNKAVPSMNFATDLLAFIEERGEISMNSQTGALEQRNMNGELVPCQVEFIAISVQPLSNSYAMEAQRYPWFRVISGTELKAWLSEELVASLQKLEQNTL